MKLSVALAVSWLFLSYVPSDAADVQVIECTTVSCPPYSGFLHIVGEITEGDITKAEQAFAARNNHQGLYLLAVNSAGGSVSEAVLLGQFVRRAGLSVLVPSDAVCYSACVYILAAGVSKWPSGKIGIHRPYFDLHNPKDAAVNISQTEALSERYLKEMNIPAQLSQDMFSTPPEEIRILTSAELRRYRLDQMDMVAAEENANIEASRLGISRVEYNKRLSSLKSSGALNVCNAIPSAEKQMECHVLALLNHGLILLSDP